MVATRWEMFIFTQLKSGLKGLSVVSPLAAAALAPGQRGRSVPGTDVGCYGSYGPTWFHLRCRVSDTNGRKCAKNQLQLFFLQLFKL